MMDVGMDVGMGMGLGMGGGELDDVLKRLDDLEVREGLTPRDDDED